jgi:hypothetical protein
MNLPRQWRGWAIQLMRYGVSFTDIGHTGHSNYATLRKTIDRTISRGASLDGRDALERASSRKPSDGRVMHVETARDVRLRLASTQPPDSFLPLVRGELARSAEPHAAILGALPAIAGARNDQRALELGQATEHREHQLTVRRGAVRPCIAQRAEASTALGQLGNELRRERTALSLVAMGACVPTGISSFSRASSGASASWLRSISAVRRQLQVLRRVNRPGDCSCHPPETARTSPYAARSSFARTRASSWKFARPLSNQLPGQTPGQSLTDVR